MTTVALAAVVVLFVASRPDSRDTPGVRSASKYGFRGGLLHGMKLAVPGAQSNQDGSVELARNTATTIDLILTVQLRENCPKPDAPYCQSAKTSRVRLNLSGLIDFSFRVLFDSKERLEVLAAGAEATTRTIPLRVPALVSGRHCLIIVAIEDDADAVNAPAIHHAAGEAFPLVVRGPNSDAQHCRPSRTRSVDTAPIGEEVRCVQAVLSSRSDVPYIKRKRTVGDPTWAMFSRCDGDVAILFAHEGLLIGPNDPLYGPAWIRQGPKAPASIRLDLAEGGWHLITLDLSRPTGVGSVKISQPALFTVG